MVSVTPAARSRDPPDRGMTLHGGCSRHSNAKGIGTWQGHGSGAFPLPRRAREEGNWKIDRVTSHTRVTRLSGQGGALQKCKKLPLLEGCPIDSSFPSWASDFFGRPVPPRFFLGNDRLTPDTATLFIVAVRVERRLLLTMAPVARVGACRS